MIARGEVWWADLGQPRGSAPALRRPTLVLSGDRYNASRLGTVTVAVITANARLAALPGNIALQPEVSGLDRVSVVNVTQIATVDRTALEKRVAALPAWVMAQVDDGVRRALAL